MSKSTSKSASAQRDPWPKEPSSLWSWLLDHRRIAAETMAFVSTRLATSLVVWLLVGIALALPSGLWLAQHNLNNMTADWQGRPGLSVYFKTNATEQAIMSVADKLQSQDAIESIEVTTADDALAEFQAFSELSDALSLLEKNPLPASVRATLEVGADPVALTDAADFARQQPAVAEVVVEKTWLERVNHITALVSRLGWVLAALFGAGAVLVTATSVRLAIEARLEEVKVLKLVGATDAQIRRPFLYFGLFYGLGGGVLAAMLLSLLLLFIEAPLLNFLGSYGQGLDLAGFTPLFLVGLLALGGLLGVWGALLAAKQRLSDLEIV